MVQALRESTKMELVATMVTIKDVNALVARAATKEDMVIAEEAQPSAKISVRWEQERAAREAPVVQPSAVAPDQRELAENSTRRASLFH